MTADAAVAPVRERLLDAAQSMIEDTGWSSVTMARIAERAGVSRQTVYNEFSNKHGLAEQLAMRELARFLDVVRERMAAEATLVEGIRAACEGALLMGEQSLLVRTIVTSLPEEQDADFLQILTTESGEIVEAAVMVVKQSDRRPLPADAADRRRADVAVEVVVRLVLSAITRPVQAARAKPPPTSPGSPAWRSRVPNG